MVILITSTSLRPIRRIQFVPFSFRFSSNLPRIVQTISHWCHRAPAPSCPFAIFSGMFDVSRSIYTETEWGYCHYTCLCVLCRGGGGAGWNVYLNHLPMACFDAVGSSCYFPDEIATRRHNGKCENAIRFMKKHFVRRLHFMWVCGETSNAIYYYIFGVSVSPSPGTLSLFQCVRLPHASNQLSPVNINLALSRRFTHTTQTHTYRGREWGSPPRQQ